MLTAAVFPDATDAANRRFQDWGGWLESGTARRDLPDGVHDRSRRSSARRSRTSNSSPGAVPCGPASARISCRLLPPSRTSARRRQLGAEGIVLFSYDNLDEPIRRRRWRKRRSRRDRLRPRRRRRAARRRRRVRFPPRSSKSARAGERAVAAGVRQARLRSRVAAHAKRHDLRSRLADEGDCDDEPGDAARRARRACAERSDSESGFRSGAARIANTSRCDRC